MSNRTIDAYAAGLLDGEGCVGMSKGPRSFGLRIDFGMTAKALSVLEQLQREYGGKITSHREATERWERVVRWTMVGPVAAEFLRRVSPYLMLKQEQTRLALLIEQIRLDLPNRKRHQKEWTRETYERCDTLYLRIKELNRKGPIDESDPMPGRTPFARFVAGQWLAMQTSLFSDLGSEPYSQTWPRCGMTCGGRAYELPTWGHLTAGNGSLSLLPTPVADHSRGLPQPGTDYASLPNAVIGLLPTPTAMDAKASGGSTPSDVTLTDAIIRTRLGTQPNPRLAGTAGSQAHPAPSATTAAPILLPTPSAADGMGGHLNRSGDRKGELLLPGVALSLGANTDPPSGDGNGSSTVPLPHPPNPAPDAGSDSPPGLWNG